MTGSSASIERPLFAFVLMPFEKAFDDVYRLGIKDVAQSAGVIAERVDEQSFSETILERIYRQIDAADFIIADMTGRNPNVFYEVGFAHAKAKICILITNNASDIPFDLKHHRHLIYGESITQLREQLSREIDWAKERIAELRTVPFTVNLRRIDGLLLKESWRAQAEIEMVVDLNNQTDKRSPDLEAIYLHTGPGWVFRNGPADCPNTTSETADYKLRHFIQPSVPRLSPGAWTQVRLKGIKNVWYKHKGEELKDEYKLSGRALLELVTTEGSYTNELDLSVEVSEFPF